VGGGGIAPPFLTLSLDGGEWSASRRGCFIPGERPLYPLARRLGGSQSRLDAVKRSLGAMLLPEFKHWPSIPEFVAISTQLSRAQGNIGDPEVTVGGDYPGGFV
jgi:hypothetical protein